MQIEKKYKIEKAASTDETRESIMYVVVGDNTATATDGRILAVCPCVVGAGEVHGPITPDSLKYARKHTLGDGASVLHLRSKDEAITEDSATFPRSLTSITKGEGEQLELIRTEPCSTPHEKSKIDIVPKADASAVTVSLDARLLLNLAEALGDAHCITLQMHPDEDNVVRKCARADGYGGAYGAIMPRVEKS